MDANEARMYEIFEELGITDFRVTEHQPIMNIEDADQFGLDMEGLNLKNLILKEKKTERIFHVIIDEHTQMDMKHFKELTGWRQVSFAGEDVLMEVLGLKPGAVTPLALFNDVDRRVTVVLGRDIVDAPDEEWISFHPCRNTATLTMRVGDFRKWLVYFGNDVVEER